ncbi:MAG: fused MFS/spermidine synthase [Gallionellaceae bacterium]|nr:fused MFS/spermidine synthase [Gallionellaceae bacterium]
MAQFNKVFVFTLAGWSGFFVMAVELLSGRILAPDFGNSIYVWGGVITVFMLALSVGYLIGGHLSLYSPTLRRLGYLLLASAVATLPVVFWGNSLLESVFEQVHDPRYGSLLASSVLFFLPMAIAGMVSPYAVRLLVTQLHASGKSAGSLYFVSTLGSAVGTISTSFYLVLLFEINQIFMGLIVVSALLSVAAVAVSKWSDEK